MRLLNARSIPLACALFVGLCAAVVPALADPVPAGAAGHNIEAVGYSELGGRPGFKMSIVQSQGRWYLYVGHFWHRGWSIVDVTDPKDPKLIKFVQGPSNTSTGQIDIGGNTMITALSRKRVDWGGDDKQPAGEGVLIWDISDPVNPKQTGHYQTGSDGTHRNYYSGGKYMHLAASVKGYRGNIYQIVDISDPAKPVEAGRWSFPGQKEGETPAPPPATSLHGPPEVVGNTVFLSYGGAGMVIVDIADVAKPKFIGRLAFSPPYLPFIGVHTIQPVPGKNLAVVNSEAIRENCNEPANHVSMVDIADLARPRLIATFPTPIPPAGSPYKSFCEKGGRFGPHNQNQLQHNPFVKKQDHLIYLTYFNAGLRIYDISAPSAPREVGYFMPPDPKERRGVLPKGLAVSSEDVLVDTRGNIFVTDKNLGLYVLRYTGQ
jgi:hypothetical protein